MKGVHCFADNSRRGSSGLYQTQGLTALSTSSHCVVLAAFSELSHELTFSTHTPGLQAEVTSDPPFLQLPPSRPLLPAPLYLCKPSFPYEVPHSYTTYSGSVFLREPF